MKLTCPLGHTCQKCEEDGTVLERCMWYVKMRGTNPNTGEELDKWGCAIAWQPILMTEATKEARTLSASVQGNRNEVKKVGDKLDIIKLDKY